jgi:hypothetical protein
LSFIGCKIDRIGFASTPDCFKSGSYSFLSNYLWSDERFWWAIRYSDGFERRMLVEKVGEGYSEQRDIAS